MCVPRKESRWMVMYSKKRTTRKCAQHRLYLKIKFTRKANVCAGFHSRHSIPFHQHCSGYHRDATSKERILQRRCLDNSIPLTCRARATTPRRRMPRYRMHVAFHGASRISHRLSRSYKIRDQGPAPSHSRIPGQASSWKNDRCCRSVCMLCVLCHASDFERLHTQGPRIAQLLSSRFSAGPTRADR
jgi:hypothetical protein